jgi:exo-1,4-beta-D-glucosaminidase
LNSLPQVKLEVETESKSSADRNIWHVTVKNPSDSVGFMAHLRLTRGKGGEDVVPILWQDNYFSLLPGEQRQVSASYNTAALGGAKAVLEVDGFNITPQTIQ